jgi:hypothetical protein
MSTGKREKSRYFEVADKAASVIAVENLLITLWKKCG